MSNLARVEGERQGTVCLGVALLLRLAERLQTRRRQLHLVVPRRSPVRRALVFTGLPRVIPVEERLEDALSQCDSG